MGFLTVGPASRGDGGFVRQLLETAGNTATAQKDEGAGGFLLPERDVSDSPSPNLHNSYIIQQEPPPPTRPGCPHPGKPLSLRITALSTFGQLWAVTQEHPREGGPIHGLSSYPGASSVVVTCFCFLDRDPPGHTQQRVKNIPSHPLTHVLEILIYSQYNKLILPINHPASKCSPHLYPSPAIITISPNKGSENS